MLERAGRTLLEAHADGGVLITRGSRGMALFEPGKPTVHIPIFGSDQIADVTGAGDTVMATMTLALAAGGIVRGGGAAGQLRRRPGGDEARHGHRVGRRAAARRTCDVGGTPSSMGEILDRADAGRARRSRTARAG